MVVVASRIFGRLKYRPFAGAAPAMLGAILAILLSLPDSAGAQDRARQKVKRAVPDQGPSAPPGPLHFVVSLKEQRGALYANGVLVAHTPISSGTASHPTPTGVFSVIQKRRHHRSNLYSNAPMPYMQRLTWSGIALHQGQLPGYPASHGCVRLPADFAQFLWHTTKLGARVIITADSIAPAEIVHPRLFQPKAPLKEADVTSALRRSVDIAVAENTLTATATDAAADGPSAPDKGTTPPADSGPIAADIPARILASFFDTLEAKEKRPAPAGPVSIFVSRKDRKLYLRQGFQALFEMPVALRDEATPTGTHVFTALAREDGKPGLRWVAFSMPSQTPKAATPVEYETRTVYRYDYFGYRIPVRVKRRIPAKPAVAAEPVQAATEVLDRLDLPQDVLERAAEYVAPGATLIVSDRGLNHETGAYTDFVVLTH
jgi:hypothetical protein